MNVCDYFDILEKKHKAYFDVYRNHKIEDICFDLYAEFHMKNQRYFLSATLDAYEVHEYRFIKSFREINLGGIRDYAGWLQSRAPIYAKPDAEHMSTSLTGVVVTEGSFSEEALKFIKNYRYTKYFALGIKGWCDIRLLGVDMATNRVVANNKGKEVLRDFQFSDNNL